MEILLPIFGEELVGWGVSSIGDTMVLLMLFLCELCFEARFILGSRIMPSIPHCMDSIALARREPFLSGLCSPGLLPLALMESGSGIICCMFGSLVSSVLGVTFSGSGTRCFMFGSLSPGEYTGTNLLLSSSA